MSRGLLLTLLFALAGQIALLNDKTCGSVDALLVSADGLQVKARCSDRGADREVRLSVSTATAPAGCRLEELILGFCGEVVGATAPKGWAASILRRDAAFGSPAMVQWRVDADRATSDGVAPHIDDFTVTMKRGWRQALTFMYTLAGSGGAVSGSPHDCGELPR